MYVRSLSAAIFHIAYKALFFMTLKKIHALTEVRGEEEPMWDDEEGEDE